MKLGSKGGVKKAKMIVPATENIKTGMLSLVSDHFFGGFQ
jgi:hypothetical protein